MDMENTIRRLREANKARIKRESRRACVDQENACDEEKNEKLGNIKLDVKKKRRKNRSVK